MLRQVGQCPNATQSQDRSAPSSANARHKQGHALKDALDTATPTKGSDIMTHEHITGFASELVQMAQAMAQVPQLEATIHRLEAQVANAEASKVDMHDALEQSRAYAATLEQRVHDLEVARDDAELRFLEADDAKDTLVRVLDSLGKDILGALQAVAPVPAAPTEVSPKVMEALSVDAPLAGQSVVDPIATNAEVGGSQPSADGVSVPTSPTSAPEPATGTGTEPIALSSEGVSVPSDPTSPTASTEALSETSSLSPTVEPKPVAIKEGASTGDGGTYRPFVPPADPTPASPVDASSSDGTEDDLGEPEGKYSSAWYHWVDEVPGRRQRILGY